MMQSSINRLIAVKTKIEHCVRNASAPIAVSSCRTLSSTTTVSLLSRNTPDVPAFATISRNTHQFQAIRSTSSSVENTSTNGLKNSYEYILVDATTHPGVGLITLHRPKALNALCDGLFADLIHAATALDQNHDDIGCIVLTGSTKAFAAGADISEMKDRTFDHAYTKVSIHTAQFRIN